MYVCYTQIRQNKLISLKLTQRYSSQPVDVDLIVREAYSSSQMWTKYRKQSMPTLFRF